MESLTEALLLSTLAGATIPLGGLAAVSARFRPRWLEQEFRHSVIAFGGGVLLAAVALVLVPSGVRLLSPAYVVISFAGGGLTFLWLDRALTRSGWRASQLLAMLLDFVPEAMALGAVLASNETVGLLLALLIALQNFPEGFNAYRELQAARRQNRKQILTAFASLVLLGPLAALGGYVFLTEHREALGALMLFAGAGILYLTFQDIAPQAHLERHWGPPLGAVAGFLLGIVGHMLIG
jgi:ZIP family zinc transporter